ncbi:IS200/IS605 family transposase [Candidatus Babeliales bacterium]|nr:IS200/IS605 family transposase [Candidatus Babeliales bacterium]
MSTTSYESLSHSKWDCKYHVVFVPKYRRKVMYGEIREFLKIIFKELANHKGCEILSGSLVKDHVHMLIRIPPKYAVAEIVGYLKGKSAIAIARKFSKRKRNFNGERFWARGYSVSTVGYDQENIKVYIKNQEKLDKQENDGTF